MKKLTIITLLAGCSVGFSAAVSAQDPLARSHSVIHGGEPLSGPGALTAAPAKGDASAAQLRLGERNPLVPPFIETFDDYPTESEFEQFARYFQVINADGDTNTSGTDRSWGLYNFNGESHGRKFSKCAYLVYPINVIESDDWLIARAINLEAGRYYHISLDASLYSENGVHAVEIKMGEYNDAEGMTFTIVPRTEISSIRPRQLEGWFVPEFDGRYYLGIHGVSERMRSQGEYLFVDNIAMDAPRSGREPAQVTDVDFLLDPDGTPSATVSFKAPAVGVDGRPISGDVTIVVKRGNSVIKTFTATPGQAIEFVDVTDAADYYDYTFTASNAAGSGCDLRLTQFIGMGMPNPPMVKSISEPSTGSVHLTWEAPATDVNGTAINPDKLRYNVYEVTPTDYDICRRDYAGTELTVNKNLQPDEQAVVTMAVTALINGEESIYSHSDLIFVGNPYELPYENHFCYSGKEAVISAYGDEGVLWRILDDFSDPQSQDGDSSYICMVGSQVDQYGELSTGKLDFTDVANPYVSFYTYIYDDDENELSISFVDCATGERTPIADYVLTNLTSIGWTRIICPMTAAAGKVGRVVIGARIQSHGYVPFDNMVIDRLSPVDLSVPYVDFIRYATANEDYYVNALISNIGADAVENYTVRLVCDGTVIDTAAGTLLEPFESTFVELSGRFTAVSPEMPTFTVEVLTEGDADLSNNTSQPFNITFLAPCHPVVSDLQGVETGAGVTLSWSAPDLSSAAPEESVEDFESYAPFTTELNGFTMLDADGGNIAGFSSIELPVKGTPQAYWTMTCEPPYDFLYTSGMSSLFTMATVNSGRRPIPNDDWLISPELYGGRQTIGFKACAQSVAYGYETFEVYASPATTAIGDFEKVMVETAVGEDWEQYYVTLPAGTRYFAIRCTSNDCLLFTLDDITYIAKGEPRQLALKGYNVYRNGRQLNSAPVTSTTFATTRELECDRYFVTAVYDQGESTASNIVQLGESGIDAVITDGADAPAEYYDLRGVRVSPSALTPGLYIVRRGSSAVKTLVR